MGQGIRTTDDFLDMKKGNYHKFSNFSGFVTNISDSNDKYALNIFGCAISKTSACFFKSANFR
jgi:N-acetylglucosamine kinase-like BadF-type ATPase